MYIAKKDNEKKVKGIRALQGIMFHAQGKYDLHCTNEGRGTSAANHMRKCGQYQLAAQFTHLKVVHQDLKPMSKSHKLGIRTEACTLNVTQASGQCSGFARHTC